MEKLISIIISLLTTFSLFLGIAGDPEYKKLAGFSEAVKSLSQKTDIISGEYIGIESDQQWSRENKYKIEDTVVLKKEKNKDFVILNITDTHFSDYDYRALTAFDVESKLKTLVASVKPDLITLSGDIVCSDESTYYSIRRITDLFESFGIPWAPFFGNHDAEGNCDKNYLADIMMSAPNCVMQKGDPDMGVGNYIINIAEENEDGSLNITESLIIMDCRPADIKKQTDWFVWASEGINELTADSAEITVMFHIPLPEYQYAYDAAWDSDNNCWKEEYNAFGECHESICYDIGPDGIPARDDFFSKMKELGTAKYVFCGHEHLNNFSIEYEGIRLTYCLKIGMGSGFRFNFSGGTEIRIGSEGINRIMHKSVAFGPVITIEDFRI